MPKRSAPDKAMRRSQTIFSMSGEVSFTFALTPQSAQTESLRPVIDVLAVVTRSDEVLHIAKLQLRARVFRPIELRDDEVFLANYAGRAETSRMMSISFCIRIGQLSTRRTLYFTSRASSTRRPRPSSSARRASRTTRRPKRASSR
jgi:hypothetical protein